MKKDKGITLIALVIIIIVSLILAGVVLQIVIGHESILEQVLKVVGKYKDASVKEQIDLQMMDCFNEAGEYQIDLVKDKLQKNLNISEEDIVDNQDGSITVNYKDYQLLINQDGGFAQSTIIYDFDSKLNETNYGDYIHYEVDLGIGNVFNNKGSESSDWRILYKDDNNNIFIIAEDCVQNNNIILSDALAKANMATLNGYNYSAYWPSTNNLTKTGSVSISDAIANKYMLSWLKSYPDSENDSIKATAALLDTNIWSGFAKGLEGAEAVGAPTVEMIVKSWNQKGYPTLYCNNMSSSGYYINNVDKPQIGYINLSGVRGYQDTLYYPHINTSSYNTCSGYWLASPSSENAKHILSVSTLGYIGNKRLTIQSYGVRPVVCLPSGLQGYPDENGVWKIMQ